jgi:hypothetical protein
MFAHNLGAYYRYDSFNSYKCKDVFTLQYCSRLQYIKKRLIFSLNDSGKDYIIISCEVFEIKVHGD